MLLSVVWEDVISHVEEGKDASDSPNVDCFSVGETEDNLWGPEKGGSGSEVRTLSGSSGGPDIRGDWLREMSRKNTGIQVAARPSQEGHWGP